MNDNRLQSKFGRVLCGIQSYVWHSRIELAVLVVALTLDLATKALVNAFMYLGETVVIIPNFLHFYYTLNRNAAFGSDFGLGAIFGDHVRTFFLVFTVLAISFGSWYMYYSRNRRLLLRVTLALILAGALGNFFDRLFIGAVRDFVQIVYFGLDIPHLGTSFAIFNIADAALTCSVPVLAFYLVFLYDRDTLRMARIAEQARMDSLGPLDAPDPVQQDSTPDPKPTVDDPQPLD